MKVVDEIVEDIIESELEELLYKTKNTLASIWWLSRDDGNSYKEDAELWFEMVGVSKSLGHRLLEIRSSL